MDVSYTMHSCYKLPFRSLFLILFMVFLPCRLWSQIAGVQSCKDQQSWIARWTISSITGPGQTAAMFDGDKKTYTEIQAPGPWIYNVDFGIMRSLSGIKLYTGSGPYSPHAYQIWVSTDNIQYALAKAGNLNFSNAANEQLIDFNGYFDAKYVRVIFTDAYNTATTYTSNRLRVWEINFLQCGVDPLIAKQITPGLVIAPSLSCADAISKDIQGVINTYYPVLLDAKKGTNSLYIAINNVKGAAHKLVPGDRILIIQMQNALISETNSMAYGDGVDNDLIASGWTDVQNTGEYEFAIVESISGKTVRLTQPLQKSYDAKGTFQVVYSPVYDNVTLKGPITAVDWDGYCGGIVTFDARTLNLNNQTIDVSSQGFRKGKMNSNSDIIRYFWNVYSTDNNLFFGEKGEGIAGAPRGSYSTISNRLYSLENAATNSGGSFGRGAPGNAGGGGANHNSGGGGGANVGSGGQGGGSYGYTSSGDMTFYWDAITPDGAFHTNGSGYFPNGGMGGTGSGTPDPFRIWMGGAGGGGHQNNNHASGGSNGGGIILATARVVKGSGSLLADGGSAGPSNDDGSGGGGAGGTIVFGFEDQSGSTITYSVKGGDGGSVTFPTAPHGPGGGGGGGDIIVSAPSTNMDVSGGKNGIHITTGSPWGANKGQDGKILVANNLSGLFTYSCDHGDAPLSFLDAAHQLKPDSLSLSSYGDADSTGFYPPPHDRDAKGDDLTGISDEDGVEQPFDTTLSTAQSIYKVKVFVHNPLNDNVYVCGWIDFNGNGVFDANEKTSITGVLKGPNVLTWNNFPADITGGDSFARFRISTGTEALSPTGVAPDGEVEDYTIHINGIPSAVPDDTCTHAGLPVNIPVVINDHIQGDKRGKITIQTPPVNGTAVTSDNNTPNDKTDDYITYTPRAGFQGTDTLTYELWNSIGNSAKARVTITVKEPITVDFSADSDEGCTPMTVKFTNQSSDKTARFTWSFGDNSPTSQNIEPTHTFKTGGDTTSVYTVKLVMNTGCGIIQTSKQIKVHPLPHAVMTVQSNDERPEIVVCKDISTNGVDRIWTLPDGSTIRGDSLISIKFDSVGPHPISLKVFNEFNCSDDTVVIHTTEFRGLYVPNAFIPESDNLLNNTFKPVGYGLKEYTLMIFDLWGNLIWKSSELNQQGQPSRGWDGKDKNGKPLPTDTYIWRIKAVLEGDKPWKGMKMRNGTYHTEGTLTIIR